MGFPIRSPIMNMAWFSNVTFVSMKCINKLVVSDWYECNWYEIRFQTWFKRNLSNVDYSIDFTSCYKEFNNCNDTVIVEAGTLVLWTCIERASTLVVTLTPKVNVQGPMTVVSIRLSLWVSVRLRQFFYHSTHICYYFCIAWIFYFFLLFPCLPHQLKY